MSAQPVTKDDLDHAIEQSESRLRGEIERTESRLMQRIAEASEHTARVMSDRMDRVGGELATRIDELATRVDDLPARMGEELARHIPASDERNLDAIRTIDDQYRSLPGEVATLRTRVDAGCGPGGETARLRRDLEAHVTDDARHLDPAQAPHPSAANDTEF